MEGPHLAGFSVSNECICDMRQAAGAVTLSLSKGACAGLPTMVRQAHHDTLPAPYFVKWRFQISPSGG
jgi:hypothetical protein